MEIVLVDLSSVAYPIWAAIETDIRNGQPHPPNHASVSIVDRVRKFAAPYDHVVVCCDTGRSFRADISPDYKGQRKEKDAVFIDQMNTAIEELKNLGFPTWGVKTFEADDLIASAVAHYTKTIDGVEILVWSADKDLWQLISPQVTCKSPNTGNAMTRAGVIAKNGVTPEQMRDFLCLTGDVSDNIQGARNIGATKASALLVKYGSLDVIYETLETKGAAVMGLTPSVAKALVEFKPMLETTKNLVSLRYDVDLPFDEALQPRIPVDRAPFDAPNMSPAPTKDTETMPTAAEQEAMVSALVEAEPAPDTPAPAAAALVPATAAAIDKPSTSLAPRVASDVTVIEVPGWSEHFHEYLWTLAQRIFASRMFPVFTNVHAVYVTLMAGKERGLTPMQSMMSLHLVEGKPTLPADLIRALVITSGAATYFRCTARTNELATFETKRKDDPPFSLTYTIQEATAAGLVKDKSGWVKSPADMLVARASAKLARLVYPDVVHGLYEENEIEVAA